MQSQSISPVPIPVPVPSAFALHSFSKRILHFGFCVFAGGCLCLLPFLPRSSQLVGAFKFKFKYCWWNLLLNLQFRCVLNKLRYASREIMCLLRRKLMTIPGVRPGVRWSLAGIRMPTAGPQLQFLLLFCGGAKSMTLAAGQHLQWVPNSSLSEWCQTNKRRLKLQKYSLKWGATTNKQTNKWRRWNPQYQSTASANRAISIPRRNRHIL